MRKLAYVCEATQGGVRKHLRELIRAFCQPSEEFTIQAILGDRGEPGFNEELNRLAREHANFQFTIVPEMRRAIRLFRDARAYSVVKEHLRQFAPDIVHTHSSKAGFIGRMAAHTLGVKTIIHTPHVFPFQWASGAVGRIYLALERRAAEQCHRIVCVGESQRADALTRQVASNEQLIVIRNGLELPPQIGEDERVQVRRSLGLPVDALVAGMVARLAPQKGVSAFVRAAAKVLEKRANAVFVLVGGGPLESEVRERMSELKIPAERLRLLGHREDAPALYPAFDMLVLSSLYEGLPYVLLEAMAWGVPVVATDVLGSRDVVADGETGFLARSNDPSHIAERIMLLMDDPPLRRRYGLAGRQRVAEQFSFEAFIDEHRRLYALHTCNSSN